MSNIRRHFVPDTPVFITAVCHDRQPHLAPPDRKALLLGILRELKSTIPFTMVAYVILDDHFHLLIEPAQTDDVPLLIQAAKLRFSRRVRPENAGTGFHVWQKRYSDHVIRNESDMDRHLDYIHYNPVKHGLVTDPAKYAWSSFKTYQSRGSYPASWGVGAPPAGLDGAGSE